MNTYLQDANVVILGSGITGLAQAAQLLRFGVYPLILDDGFEENNPTFQHDQTLILNLKSLEMFRQMGLWLPLKEISHEISSFHLFKNKANEAFSHLGYLGEIGNPEKHSKSDSFFTRFRLVSSIKLRKMLIEHLSNKACKIWWNVQTLKIEQNDRTVSIKLTDGTEDWICNTKYLVMSHSRKVTRDFSRSIQLQKNKLEAYAFAFEFGHDGVQAQTYNESGVAHEKVLGSTRRQEFNPLGPIRDRRIMRVGEGFFQSYSLSSFLINHALTDVWNLGWKLSMAIQIPDSQFLLKSYTTERGAQTELVWNKYVTKLNLLQHAKGLKKKLGFWQLEKYLKKINKSKAFLADQWASWNQVSMNYRNSKLSHHHSRYDGVQAGDRMPYFTLFDEKLKTQTDTHAWCEKPGFMILILGTMNPNNLHVLSQWIKQKYPRDLYLFYLPYSLKNKNVFDCFQMGENEQQMIILRPDMHIAYMGNYVQVGLIENYLKSIVGF